jgi:hypothetical protein
MKNETRIILQFSLPVAGKVAKTIATRAARLQRVASKRGAKLRLLIPGLIMYANTLRSLDIKTGPNDKKTGAPKYWIYRGKLENPAPKPVKPVKPAKADKKVKMAKVAKVARKVRRHRRHRRAPVATAPVTSVPTAATPPPASVAPAPTAPPPVGAVTPGAQTELAAGSEPSSPAAAARTHARHSRKGGDAPAPGTTP